MNLLCFWRSFVKWGLIVASPLLVVVFLLLPAMDRFSPWAEADQAVGEVVHLCVGMTAWRFSHSEGIDKGRQRSYLVPVRRELVTVTDEGLKGQDLSIESSHVGFWMILLLFAVLLFTSIRYSLPMIASKIKQAQQSSSSNGGCSAQI